MREIGSIVGLRVLTLDEAVSIGTVSQVVVDLAQGHVLGLILQTSAGERAVAADAIHTIGADVVMVVDRKTVLTTLELPELQKFRRAANAAPLQVFTTSGKRLGAISAVMIDPLEKVVTRYEVSGGPLKDMAEGILILPVMPGCIHGQDAVIIPDETVEQMGRETGGLLTKFNVFGQKVRGQYQQAAVKVEQAVDKSAEVLKKEAAVVKDKTGELTGKARQKAREAAQTMGEVVDKGAETLKKEAATVKEKAEELGEKAKATVTTAWQGEESKDVEATEPPAPTAETPAEPAEAAPEPDAAATEDNPKESSES